MFVRWSHDSSRISGSLSRISIFITVKARNTISSKSVRKNTSYVKRTLMDIYKMVHIPPNEFQQTSIKCLSILLQNTNVIQHYLTVI